VQESTTNIVVLKVATASEITLERVKQHLATSIEGQEATFDDHTLQELTDMACVKKIYKFSLDNSVKLSNKRQNIGNGNKSATTEMQHAERQILGIMALRGAT